jgi:cellulose synthase (UDP-forming)
VGLGILALLNYFSWWFRYDLWRSPWLLVALAAALFYSSTQLVANWVLYLKARRPDAPPPPPPDLTVDVFITAYDEPLAMVERCLVAVCGMSGSHRTWLLDDGPNPELADLAQRLGADYLTRGNRNDAKAGNLNAALARTDGQVIAIFDIDHVPRPDYLERTLGHFTDPQTGFVQVMLTFDNSHEGWVARSAMETSLEYYNPLSLGANTVGGTTLMGSNALIRRSALESIDGYQPGLAEDLATSLALHSAGWRSAYVAEPLAPGMAPPSLAAWFVQQMKWARGVFELLITVLPRLFRRLTWGQRLAYSSRMTRYLIGPVVSFHLLATIAVLIFGDAYTRAAFHQYLLHLAPVVLCDVLIRSLALHVWRHESTPNTSLLGAITLVYATWPLYLLAWLMATLRLPLPFRSTPKSKSGDLNPLWLAPQIIAVLLLMIGIFLTVIIHGHRPSILLLFAVAQASLQLLLLAGWMYSESTILRRFVRAFYEGIEMISPGLDQV